MSENPQPQPTDREVLEDIRGRLVAIDALLVRAEPLLKMAETWTKTKLFFGRTGKKS